MVQLSLSLPYILAPLYALTILPSYHGIGTVASVVHVSVLPWLCLLRKKHFAADVVSKV